jgi:hypothetical protein
LSVGIRSICLSLAPTFELGTVAEAGEEGLFIRWRLLSLGQTQKKQAPHTLLRFTSPQPHHKACTPKGSVSYINRCFGSRLYSGIRFQAVLWNRILIRIRIKKSKPDPHPNTYQIKIRIRMRIPVISRIRIRIPIRINVMRIHNTVSSRSRFKN